MRKSLRSLLCPIALAGLLYMSGSASATALAPGASVTPGIETGAYTFVASTPNQAFNLGDGTLGTVSEEVVRNFAGSPFGPGTLSFVYQVSVNSGEVEHVTGTSFKGFSVDVGQAPVGGLLGTGNVAATSANRSGNGSIVSFNFGSGVNGGDTSYVLIVNTNATAYKTSTLGVIDGGGFTGAGFQPAVAPEFGSASLMGLMLVGFGGIYGVRRFRMPAMA